MADQNNPIKLPDLTQDDRSMNELETALRKASRSLRDFDTSVTKVNKAKLGLGFTDATAALDKWKKTILENAVASRQNMEKAGELSIKALEGPEKAARKMVGTIETAETGIVGFVGGVIAVAKAVDAATKMFMDSQRAGMVAAAAGASAQTGLIGDIAETARLAGLWRMSEQQVGDAAVAILGRRTEGLDEELASFNESIERGGTHMGGVLDMMTTTWGQTGVSVQAQMEMLSEELRKGQIEFGRNKQGMRAVNQNLLIMSDASAITGTDLSVMAKNVMAAGSELTIFKKKTPEITSAYEQYAASLQDGSMQMSTFTQIIGGFTKTATPSQMVAFGKMAAMVGGKEGAAFRRVEAKGGTAAQQAAGFRSASLGLSKDPENLRKLMMNVGKAMGGKTTADIAELVSMLNIPGLVAGNVPETQKFLETGKMPARDRAAAMARVTAVRAARKEVTTTTALDEAGIKAGNAAAKFSQRALGGADGQPLSVMGYVKATEEIWTSHPLEVIGRLIKGDRGYKTSGQQQADALDRVRRIGAKGPDHIVKALNDIKDVTQDHKESTDNISDKMTRQSQQQRLDRSQDGQTADNKVKGNPGR